MRKSPKDPPDLAIYRYTFLYIHKQIPAKMYVPPVVGSQDFRARVTPRSQNEETVNPQDPCQKFLEVNKNVITTPTKK